MRKLFLLSVLCGACTAWTQAVPPHFYVTSSGPFEGDPAYVFVANWQVNKWVGRLQLPATYDLVGIAASPNAQYVYVLNYQVATSAEEVLVISTKTLTTVATIALPGANGLFAGPNSIVASPDGLFIYATGNNGYVYKICALAYVVLDAIPITDPIDGPPADLLIPTGLVVSPDGLSLYVLSRRGDKGGRVSVIATVTDTVEALYPVGSGISTFPNAAAITPDGNSLYVVNCPATSLSCSFNTPENTVDIFSISNGRVIAALPIAHANSVAISPSGKEAYVAQDVAPDLTVIDTTSQQIVTQIDLYEHLTDLAFSPDGAYVYVTAPGENSITAISTAERKVVGGIAIPGAPSRIAFLY